MNYEAAIKMQKICTGEKEELTIGEITEEVIDIDKLISGMDDENKEKCRKFYDSLTNDKSKKMYDATSLIEETDEIKRKMDDFVIVNVKNDILGRIFGEMDEFFMNTPFEGLDNIEYGVNEVCVFALIEYFIWKTDKDHDHGKCRRRYRNDIANRTYEEVADHWIGVYDDLQKRYDELLQKMQDIYKDDKMGESVLSQTSSIKEMIAGCSLITIAAIRDQDAFSLDMVQEGAGKKGCVIARECENGSYEAGESVFTDNAVRLYRFICGFLNI